LDVAAGTDSGLALKTNGTIWGWGNNNYGQVGDFTVLSRSSPVQVGVAQGTSWIAIAKAPQTGYASYAINSANQLYAWG